MKFNTFVRKSDVIKTRLLKVAEECKGICAQQKDPALLSKRLLEKLGTHEELSSAKYKEFEDMLDKLLSEVDETDKDFDKAAVTTIQQEIYDCFVLITSYCRVPRAQESHLDHSTTSESEKHPTSVVRLPRLELPQFNGDLNTFMTFYNVFVTTIIENASLSDVQKFQYLLASLRGSALNLVRQLPLTAPNFKIAWDLICQRYHNKRRLLSLHLNKIVDLPNVQRNSLNSLRQFLSTYEENVQALKALDHDLVEGESPLLVTILLRKIDIQLRKKFEDSRAEHDLPSTEDLIKFLENECISTEDSYFLNPFKFKEEEKAHHSSQTQSSGESSKGRRALFISSNPRPTSTCHFCKQENHIIYQCPNFHAKTTQERFQAIKSNGWCTNCLGTAHTLSSCDSQHKCKKCSRRHHTLIHLDSPLRLGPSPSGSSKTNPKNGDKYIKKLHPNASKAANDSAESEHRPNSTQEIVAFSREVQSPGYRVLLGTALVKVTHNGISQVLRGCLDSAAMATFISSRAAQLLKVKRTYSPRHVHGISSTPVKSLGSTELIISSLNDSYVSKPVGTLILEKITSNLPDTHISPIVKTKMKNWVLADPTFDLPSPIDILIGCDLFPHLITGENIMLGENLPMAIGTHLGYVLMGKTPVLKPGVGHPQSNLTLLFTQDSILNDTLLKFWQTEEPPQHHEMSEDDKFCEEFFKSTTSRDEEGRFIVRLPRKPDVKLGDSSEIALSQFASLEKRLTKQEDLKKLYIDFMEDYLVSGHMKSTTTPFNSDCYYLPHHGVRKENSTTTKLRVVFNASQKSSNGRSLNDSLLPGPKMQTDVTDVILNFRHHSIVFVCDIKKMYRQIKIHEEDQLLQLIYWRSSADDPIKTYALTTVTYGVTSSPYLAIRTLKQLENEDGQDFSEAAKVLQFQIYMDDCLAGASSVEKAMELRLEFCDLLKKGQFSLRKWISNCPQLLESLPKDYLEPPLMYKNSEPFFNVLGLQWNPQTDCFSYQMETIVDQVYTKRSILSIIAKLFDPCGMLSPSSFWAKCFIQILWTLGIQWDEELPPSLVKKWKVFAQELPQFENIRISRPLLSDISVSVSLIGFCDASELGYAACVYVRCQDDQSHLTKITLLFAKSKVAPLKKLSLPRLELNGAHLLAKIMHYCYVTLSKHMKIDTIHSFCDSTIVLAWIQTPPYQLRTYIANRIAEIQQWLPPTSWSHVKSAENPADCASRGLMPSQLIDHPLWWTGPEWLPQPISEWPKPKIALPELETLPEVKPSPVDTLAVLMSPDTFELLTRYSNWTRLQTVFALVRRFIHNCRSKQKLTGSLTVEELRESTYAICRLIQQKEFSNDINSLDKGKPCSVRLQRLAPFIDESGLVRVGGRLRKASNLSSEAKHPILLPKSHHVTSLLIDYFHIKHLHAGPQLLQALLAQQFWILSARSIIRTRIFRCNRCFRCKPVLKPPFMGDLPESRITAAKPFDKTGIDFGGPFYIKISLQRRCQHIKAYLCVFVCFTTKAVHLEIVSDLTTDAFIAALTRFTSRRGIPHDIYSDCGTNLIGASNKLSNIVKHFFSQDKHQSVIHDHSLKNGIKFHFNAPAAPHQGGLWESAIKSAKYHLTRVIGEYVLTLEELITLVTKVEAVLNSRPITVLSTDPSEPEVLTPGHFLIGTSLLAVPEPTLDNIPLNRLKRWQVVQAFSQRIWHRWHLEYLNSLQQRSKWTQKNKSLQPGDVVIIHEPDTPPLQWKIGKIETTFPGEDNIVRVVEVRTSKGLFRRPAVKIFKLPQEED